VVFRTVRVDFVIAVQDEARPDARWLTRASGMNASSDGCISYPTNVTAGPTLSVERTGCRVVIAAKTWSRPSVVVRNA
jgi:hypothetical protein